MKQKNLYIILGVFCLSVICYFLLKSNKPEVSVLTYHYNNARTGANLAEKILKPENVNVKNFGKLFSLPVDGMIYAQPLYFAGTLFVATEHDSVYAFDVRTKKMLWKKSFIDPSRGITTIPSTDIESQDLVPEIGITGTPVIDSQTNTLYVVARTKRTAADSSVSYQQELYALDTRNGNEKFGSPTTIAASSTNEKGEVINFDALYHNQRSALLLENGRVYIAWASLGDDGPYHGWILAYQADDVTKQVASLNITKNGVAGGVWMSGGGVSSDGKNLYAAVGNGTFDPAHENYGDSVIAMDYKLAVTDYFTPFNQAYLQEKDLDMGVSEVIFALDAQGSSTLITADKMGKIYFLDSKNLGKFNQDKNNIPQELISSNLLINNLAYFNHVVYVGASRKPLQAFTQKNGVFNKTSETSNRFGTDLEKSPAGFGTNPIISSDDTKNAIVWAIDSSPFKINKPAILHAYDAYDLSKELYNTTQAGTRDEPGVAVKFSAPVVANGLVFVPGDKSVTVYGLLP